ncbi:RNA 2',3'-cyclic phosphodiesterase [Paraburkholderia unamae]|uniref:RNA 2',3'-cyclic phosphodiesterase n=1 Tax=Paraburkholderia unamae TaxID=219649 RepID=A0ABX5KCG4_9BURK|nr:RNA 2',3'-cyclic phosphodiesterase [Paraburkholderia unamae]PVX74091.1 2'-5' RNA ligase [Paraburkholderia unamae]RAR55716.1 2'-5' RNA ligase [Paraburkholderia unamae]CAG9261763.1 RNA 2',3'-cyclic phosphodiesterase [Paraburkholderia unamae]
MSEARETDRETQQWRRCFVALSPDPATRDALAALAVPANARRVPSPQLHLTVAFIGAMSFDQGDALSRRLAEHAPRIPPSQVTHIESWPGRAHPRLMVAVLAMSDAFTALDWRVRSLMGDVGLPLDARAFRPHVTLARFARDAVGAPATADGEALPPLRFESLVLYSSTLAKQGARYEALTSVALG